VTAGETSRSLAQAAWLSGGALPRLLGVLDRGRVIAGPGADIRREAQGNRA